MRIPFLGLLGCPVSGCSFRASKVKCCSARTGLLHLSNLIHQFWLYDGYSSAYMRERIYPTGTFELVFTLRR
jgi:hypothetical protein